VTEKAKQRANSSSEPPALLPGRKPVIEQLERAPEAVDMVYILQDARGKEIDRIISLCKSTKVRRRPASKSDLDRMVEGNHQGVVARLFSPGFLDVDALMEKTRSAPLPVIVALDQVQDPGNVGTLARTLFAMGGGGLLIPKDRSAFLGPAAYKASAGALATLPVAKVVNMARALDDLMDQGFWIYGAEAEHEEGGITLFEADFAFPAVIVLGNEEKGIRQNVAKRCENKLYIPLPGGFDSLNVAQAGAMILLKAAEAKRREDGYGNPRENP
jgi:23S rRNA (guanosine2251-2'-O)-methyltransferase